MGIKVAKFGGSSVADGIQIKKTREIIDADPARKVIVVSAPGRRFDEDIKITDVLYLCETHREHNLPYDQLLQVVQDRFTATAANLGSDIDLAAEFDIIREKLKNGCSPDYIVSRGEYLNAILIADFLGYDFVDTEGLIFFDNKGKLLEEETDSALGAELAGHDRVVLPGFYGTCKETGRIKTNFGAFVTSVRNESAEVDFTRYQGSLFVSNDPKDGAPVVWETNPTYYNLAGKVEYESRQGYLYTDFRRIVAGAFHKANGGFLVLDAEKVLMNFMY